jgi:hypothetical protein
MARQAREAHDFEANRVRRRVAAWLAWSAGALCMALAALAATLDFRTPELGHFAVWFGVTLLVYPTVGALVVSHRPMNAVGYILLGLGLVLEIQVFAVAYSDYARFTQLDSPTAKMLGEWANPWTAGNVVLLGLVLLVLLFPDGRLPASYFRGVLWMAVVGTVLVSIWWLTWSEETALGRLVMMLGQFGLTVVFISCVASMFAVLERLQRAEARERQQLKWFGYGAALFLIAVFFLEFAVYETSAWLLFAVIVVGLTAMPVAVGIAMLRYRLYDIDVLINRTLVYGVLTALLVGFYFGSIVVLQGIASVVLQVSFVVLTGEKSTLAVVASTLLIAALFNPLRRRIQTFIDRRFYRRKYDAVKTLEILSLKLRDETDLGTLNDDPLGVVRDTMQPVHVSLWLWSESAASKTRSQPKA